MPSAVGVLLQLVTLVAARTSRALFAAVGDAAVERPRLVGGHAPARGACHVGAIATALQRVEARVAEVALERGRRASARTAVAAVGAPVAHRAVGVGEVAVVADAVVVELGVGDAGIAASDAGAVERRAGRTLLLAARSIAHLLAELHRALGHLSRTERGGERRRGCRPALGGGVTGRAAQHRAPDARLIAERDAGLGEVVRSFAAVRTTGLGGLRARGQVGRRGAHVDALPVVAAQLVGRTATAVVVGRSRGRALFDARRSVCVGHQAGATVAAVVGHAIDAADVVFCAARDVAARAHARDRATGDGPCQCRPNPSCSHRDSPPVRPAHHQNRNVQFALARPTPHCVEARGLSAPERSVACRASSRLCVSAPTTKSPAPPASSTAPSA